MESSLDLNLIQAADDYLDQEQQRKIFRERGEELYQVFRANEGRVSTQVRNLQQIVISARRLSDVEDFVKNQMGKKSGAEDWRSVGDHLLKDLEQIRQQADKMAKEEPVRLRLRIYLARGWVKAVVGNYMYHKAIQEIPHA
jgi:hypothetical protein